MKVGEFSIEHLSEGQFELFNDGSLIKTDAPHKKKSSKLASELYEELYLPMGVDPILVRGKGATVLLDAGLGIGLDTKKRDPAISNIITNLEIFEVDPSEVTHVILSHMHHDHTGGLAYADKNSRITSTLPNAKIIAQRSDWEFALTCINENIKYSDVPYELDNLFRLVADQQIEFIDQENMEIIPGIEIIRTGGHTPGHQIVRIRDAGETAYYFGDLIPNEEFLNFTMIPDADVEESDSRQIKMLLMKQAFLESAQVLFYHSVHLKSGKLTRDPNRQYVLSK
ncbi:MAG TPA: hypothetical protein DCE78_09355 [Bacteroidetes bacterium]|nr:hypothetical protein [Bacteroidota bacterium]